MRVHVCDFGNETTVYEDAVQNAYEHALRTFPFTFYLFVPMEVKHKPFLCLKARMTIESIHFVDSWHLHINKLAIFRFINCRFQHWNCVSLPANQYITEKVIWKSDFTIKKRYLRIEIEIKCSFSGYARYILDRCTSSIRAIIEFGAIH